MTLKRSVAAAYQLKIEVYQITWLIKYSQFLWLKSLDILYLNDILAKFNVCVKCLQSRILKMLKKVLLLLTNKV